MTTALPQQPSLEERERERQRRERGRGGREGERERGREGERERGRDLATYEGMSLAKPCPSMFGPATKPRRERGEREEREEREEERKEREEEREERRGCRGERGETNDDDDTFCSCTTLRTFLRAGREPLHSSTMLSLYLSFYLRSLFPVRCIVSFCLS